MPIFFQNNIIAKLHKPLCYYKRVITDEGKRKFINSIKDIDWNQQLSSSDPSLDEYDILINIISSEYNKCFPFTKSHKSRKNTPRKVWMTESLVRSCRKKEKLYKLYVKNQTEHNKLKYKNYRNKLNKLLHSVEQDYYHTKFELLSHDTKKTWQIIKTLLGKNMLSVPVESFKCSSTLISDKNEIANKFNEFFVNVGPTLAAKIPVNPVMYNSFLKGDYSKSFSLLPTDPAEILSVVRGLKTKSSAGYDLLSTEMLKLIIPFLAEPLANIINLSFASGKMPDSLKIARVCPVYKTGDPSDFTNYRPISILPSISKIFEKLVYNRLSAYLTKHSILYKNQYGFRTNHDTCMAVTEMVEKISNAIDTNCFAIGVFIDLSKAFDTLDHAILLKKLEHYGIRGIPLAWFQSYLTNRYQYVDYYGVHSVKLKIRTGVPQGSILGPLLFLLYINDIAYVSPKLHLILFADDTNIFCQNKNLSQLITILNEQLVCLSTWFASNRLSLNIKKTNYIIFSSPYKKISTNYPDLSINGTIIERVRYAKFLGIYIDEHLNWNEHIQQTTLKVAKNVGIICKIRGLLSAKIVTALYNSLILPYLTYCNMVWINASQYRLRKLIVLQKRVVRLIGKANRFDHSSLLFKQCKTLKVLDIGIFQKLVFIYKFTMNLLPENFRDYFPAIAAVHTHYTRGSNGLIVPFARTNIKKNSISVSGPYLWNKLPINIRASQSLYIFKSRLKSFILDEY
jgi:hypothetical protein